MKNEGWFNLRLIKNKENLGPCVARNNGIMVAHKESKYIWMLDNDVVVDSEALIELVNLLENHKKIGIVGSVNYYYKYPEEIYYIGNILNWSTWIFKNVENKHAIKSTAYSVDCVATSSLLIRKDVIKEIGLLDTAYFCYFNDVDWCIRAKKAGYKIFSVLTSKVWHKVSKSTKKVSGFKIYFSMRNLIILIKKNATAQKYRFFLIYLFIYYLPRNLLSIISQKNIIVLKSFLKGFKDGLLSKQQSFTK